MSEIHVDQDPLARVAALRSEQAQAIDELTKGALELAKDLSSASWTALHATAPPTMDDDLLAAWPLIYPSDNYRVFGQQASQEILNTTNDKDTPSLGSGLLAAGEFGPSWLANLYPTEPTKSFAFHLGQWADQMAQLGWPLLVDVELDGEEAARFEIYEETAEARTHISVQLLKAGLTPQEGTQAWLSQRLSVSGDSWLVAGLKSLTTPDDTELVIDLTPDEPDVETESTPPPAAVNELIAIYQQLLGADERSKPGLDNDLCSQAEDVLKAYRSTRQPAVDALNQQAVLAAACVYSCLAEGLDGFRLGIVEDTNVEGCDKVSEKATELLRQAKTDALVRNGKSVEDATNSMKSYDLTGLSRLFKGGDWKQLIDSQLTALRKQLASIA